MVSNRKSTLLFILLSTCCFFHVCSQTQQLLLYPGNPPNNISTSANIERVVYNPVVDSLAYDVSVPTLTYYPPTTATKRTTAIIVIPGGGYQVLLTRREGSAIAQAFNSHGYPCFVLKYRLPSDRAMSNKAFVPLQDLQQAIKTVRETARQWDVHPDSIGIIGFSAGGHLASTAITHFDTCLIDNRSGTSVRPAFAMLINPVVSFSAPYSNVSTRTRLLGTQSSVTQRRYYSAEENVKKNGPPTLLIHSNEDTVVDVDNSVALYTALKKIGVPAAIHVYARGEHGFLSAPPFSQWFSECLYWLEHDLTPIFTDKKK